MFVVWALVVIKWSVCSPFTPSSNPAKTYSFFCKICVWKQAPAVEHILAILVLLFWNETCKNVLARLKWEKTGEIRRDKRESREIRRDEPRISQDWAILVSLVSSNLNRDKQKCACSFKTRETIEIRRSNEDRPPVPVWKEQKQRNTAI